MHDSPISRRSLLQTAALATGASVLTGTNSHAAAQPPALKSGDVVLLQGDSITDAGRDKGNDKPNDLGALGRGYAAMVASALLGAHPGKKLMCYNRGISGNKVPDLDARWKQDCIDLNPAVLSILIGVNDMWHVRGG